MLVVVFLGLDLVLLFFAHDTQLLLLLVLRKTSSKYEGLSFR